MMAQGYTESVDQLQDLETPISMPRPWTAYRRGPSFKEDSYTDSLPPISAARFRLQRRAKQTESEKRGPVRVTRTQSFRQPVESATQAGKIITNMNHAAPTVGYNLPDKKIQYESDSDFFGSSESQDADAIDELCSTSARIRGEIMELTGAVAIDVPSSPLLSRRSASKLRRSVSFNDRTGITKGEVQQGLVDQYRRSQVAAGHVSTASRPYSAWTDCSKTSQPINARSDHDVIQDNQSVNSFKMARNSNKYEHEYINNDNLDGWSDEDDDSLFSDDGDGPDLDSGYENDGDELESLNIKVQIESKVQKESKIQMESKAAPSTPPPNGHLERSQIKSHQINNNTSAKDAKAMEQTPAFQTTSVTPRPRSRSLTRSVSNPPRASSNPPMSRLQSSPPQSSRVEDWLVTCREQHKSHSYLPDIRHQKSPRS